MELDEFGDLDDREVTLLDPIAEARIDRATAGSNQSATQRGWQSLSGADGQGPQLDAVPRKSPKQG